VGSRGQIRCRFDPPLTFQGVGNAVCQAPAGLGSHSVSVQIYGSQCEALRFAYLANGTQVLLCPPGGCTCASLLFDTPCGSFNGYIYVNVYNMEVYNSSYVNSVLQTVGIGSINTLYGKLSLSFSATTAVTWPFSIFSSLQVVRPLTAGPDGILFDITGTASLTFVPGAGFSQLIACSSFEFSSSSVIQNTDLQLVSSLQCVGYINAPANVVSLAGLDRLSDGVAGSYSSYIVVDSRTSTRLTNITALSLYGKCGTAAQLPSTWPSRPFVKVAACVQAFSTWPAVCNYIVNSTCS
jgi:hypothetical protein